MFFGKILWHHHKTELKWILPFIEVWLCWNIIMSTVLQKFRILKRWLRISVRHICDMETVLNAGLKGRTPTGLFMNCCWGPTVMSQVVLVYSQLKPTDMRLIMPSEAVNTSLRGTPKLVFTFRLIRNLPRRNRADFQNKSPANCERLPSVCFLLCEEKNTCNTSGDVSHLSHFLFSHLHSLPHLVFSPSLQSPPPPPQCFTSSLRLDPPNASTTSNLHSHYHISPFPCCSSHTITRPLFFCFPFCLQDFSNALRPVEFKPSRPFSTCL